MHLRSRILDTMPLNRSPTGAIAGVSGVANSLLFNTEGTPEAYAPPVTRPNTESQSTETTQPALCTPVVHPTNFEMSSRQLLELIPEYKENDTRTFINKCELIHSQLVTAQDRSLFYTMVSLKLPGAKLERYLMCESGNWENLRSVILQDNRHRNTLEHLQLQLTSFKQGSDDLSNFANKIRRALLDLNEAFLRELGGNQLPGAVTNLNERQVLRAFEDGLKDEKLRNIVIAKGCESVEKAIDYAISMSWRMKSVTPAIISCRKCGKTGHTIDRCYSGYNNNNRNNNDNNNKGGNYNYNTRGIRTNRLPDYNVSRYNGNQPPPRNNYHGGNNYNGNNNNNTRNPFNSNLANQKYCNYCKKPGHEVLDCILRPDYINNGNTNRPQQKRNINVATSRDAPGPSGNSQSREETQENPSRVQ